MADNKIGTRLRMMFGLQKINVRLWAFASVFEARK